VERRHFLADDEEFLDRLLPTAGETSPDLKAAKRRYRRAFMEAFKHALTGLPPKEVTLLRCRFDDGMSLEQIGEIYRVHRSTVHRWIDKARQTLIAGTRARLREQLEISESQCDSILRLINTTYDMTLRSFFGKKSNAE
jgi:RNA polymerase sigma-70 factor (ECF subfamily)